VADSIVYLHSSFRGGLRKTHAFWNTVHNGPSRSSEVVDLDTNRKRICNFLWSSIVTLVLSCLVSETLQVSGERPHPYSTRILGTFPLDYIANVVAPRSEDAKLFIRVINFELFQSICPRYVSVTDRRTDGQLKIAIPRLALRASHGNNNNNVTCRVRWCLRMQRLGLI